MAPYIWLFIGLQIKSMMLLRIFSVNSFRGGQTRAWWGTSSRYRDTETPEAETEQDGRTGRTNWSTIGLTRLNGRTDYRPDGLVHVDVMDSLGWIGEERDGRPDGWRPLDGRMGRRTGLREYMDGKTMTGGPMRIDGRTDGQTNKLVGRDGVKDRWAPGRIHWRADGQEDVYTVQYE